MKYTAIRDKIIAQKVKQEEKTVNGLLLPGNIQKRYNEAVVVDIDPKLDTPLKVGDHFRYHVTLHEYEDGIIILREDHIDAIIVY